MPQKSTYDKLKQRAIDNELYHALLEASNDAIIAINSNGNIILFNPAAEKIFGFVKEMIIGSSLECLIPEEYKAEHSGYVKSFFSKGHPRKYIGKTIELSAVHADGHIFPIELSLSAGHYNEEHFAFAIIRDVTSYKDSVRKLQQSEETIKSIFRAAPTGIGMVRERVLMHVNDRFCEMTGYTSEELIGQNARMLYLTNEDYEYVGQEKYAQIQDHGIGTVETQLKCKDGQVIDVLMSSTPLDSNDWSKGVTFTALDITEAKTQVRMLRESEERYRTVADFTFDWEHWLGPDGHFIYISPSCENVTGYNVQEFMQDPSLYVSIVHPDDREIVRAHLLQDRGSSDPCNFDFRILDRQGNERWICHNCQPVYDRGGKWLGRRGSNREITARKREEQKVQASEERYRMLFNGGNDAVFVYPLEANDHLAKFSEVNELASRKLGYTKEELLNLSLQDIAVPVLGHESSRLQEDFLAKDHVLFECELISKNGRRIPVEINSHLFKLSGEKTVISIARDLTKRKEIEAERAKLGFQLREAQKMEAIGTLAGGIAHDFNNILSPLMLYTEMAIMDLPDDSPVRANLKEALKASERARDLVKQILTFSRQEDQDQVPIRIGPIVKEALKLIRSSLPSTIEIKQQIDPHTMAVIADPVRIHQVVMNLCTNASHTMRQKGGIIQVDFGNIDLDANKAAALNLSPGPFLKLTIRDTGDGIEQNILNRIFDPYFTTKGKGEGTGMGLAVVHGIVTGCGGTIKVQSEPGVGTCFNIYLPGIEKEVTDPTIAINIPSGQNESILFVDDEEPIVQAAKSMLKRLDYQVTIKTDSLEALEAFRANPDYFDLVITDQTMPRMTGYELTRELMQIRSDIPVILCTGFSELINEAEALAIGIKAFVMKPVIRSEIASTIKTVLENKDE